MSQWSIRAAWHWSYWLKQPFTARDEVAVILWVAMALLVAAGVAGVLFKMYAKNAGWRRIWNELALGGIAGGIYGLGWMFFRQQRIPFWSVRAWLVPLAIFLIWRGYRAYHFYTQRVPVIQAEQKQRELRERYLPKPAKH